MSFIAGLESFVRSKEPLAPHLWLRVGGEAEFFAEPHSVEQLSTLLARCKQESKPVRLLGGGSNVLAADAGVRGVVIRLADPQFAKIEVQNQRITAGGGARLGHVVNSAVAAGLAGLEALVGIPGTIGGALHSNAGGRGGDIGQWTRAARVMNHAGEIVERQREELDFAYRQSSLDDLVILEADFDLESDDPIELTKRMQKQWILKKAGQPLSNQNTGCIFKNPRGIGAGMLIDQCGLKGLRIGGAEVSDRHANYFITHDGATCRDVLALIEQVRARVSEKMGIDLETQIELWQ